MATHSPLRHQAVLDPPVGATAGGLTRRGQATGAQAQGSGETWPIRRAWVSVAAATSLALGLRLLLVRSIWVDEAISIHQAHMSLAGMLHDLRATDNHPPLYFLILWGTVRVLGFGQLAVHIPTIVAGTLLVPAVYLAGTELFGRRTGALAAALTSVAPLLIWYAQAARPYAFFMLLATLLQLTLAVERLKLRPDGAADVGAARLQQRADLLEPHPDLAARIRYSLRTSKSL